MGRRLGRGAGLVAAGVTAWALLMPGIATADNQPEQVAGGDHAATIHNCGECDEPTYPCDEVDAVPETGADAGALPNAGTDTDDTDADSTDADADADDHAGQGPDSNDEVAEPDGAENTDTGTATIPDSPGPATAEPGAADQAPDVVTDGKERDATSATSVPAPSVALPGGDTLEGTGGAAITTIRDTTSGTLDTVGPLLNGVTRGIRQILSGNDGTPPPEPAPDQQTDPPQQGTNDTASEEAIPTAPDDDTSAHANHTHVNHTISATAVSAVPTGADENLGGAVPHTPAALDADTPTADPPAPDVESQAPDSERERAEAPYNDPEVHAGDPDSGLRDLVPHEQPRVSLLVAVLTLVLAVTTVSRRVAHDRAP